MSEPDPRRPFTAHRAALAAWERSRPSNYWLEDASLRSAVRHWAGDEPLRAHADTLARCGADAAGPLDDWARETNRTENLPRLRRFDGNGRRVEAVDFHPLYHELGRTMYGSGLMSLYAEPGQELVQLTMFLLFAENGEAGHCCPLACTAGAIRLLQQVGTPAQQARYLPRLLDPSYDRHLHGAQFLTELQGGSDVGANDTVAVPAADGSWRLYGEKWFCSVVDAGLWVLTARPEGAASGTRGLMTFVAPRTLPDGQPNHFEIKRLKDKIGTRSMASAELDLDGLWAEAVGPPGEGFKNVVEIVLNTSRLYNGFAAAGMTRRAWHEARRFAEHRQAFGQPIVQYPAVRRALARLRTEAAAQLATSLHVARLAGRLAGGQGTPDEALAFRFLVNANKYWTALGCTQALHEAIEVFGGNGTIEEFSVLPRLYRDAIVIESWEGTHNVLGQQLLRDMARYGVHRPVLEHALARLADPGEPRLGGRAVELARRVERQGARAGELLRLDPAEGALHIRPWLDRTMALLQGCDLLSEAQSELRRGEDTGLSLVLDYHLLASIERPDPFNHPAYGALEERLLHE